MKIIFAILTIYFSLCFTTRHYNVVTERPISSDSFLIKQAGPDSPQSIRIINNSSLKRLPGIIRDLCLALKESELKKNGLLNKNGFSIYLNDMHCKTFEVSAAVSFYPGDTVYNLRLNSFNKQASDIALAATLIHEIMHCILINIYKNAVSGDENSYAIIKSFDSLLKNRYPGLNNNFFFFMNMGEDGQHELMYRLLYPGMVSLLERFGKIHRPALFYRGQPELLMWSGLQKTWEYEKLSYEERKEIETAILEEKGLTMIVGD